MNHINRKTTKLVTACVCIAFLFSTAAQDHAKAQTNDDPLTGQISQLQSELNQLSEKLSPSKTNDSDEAAIRKLVKQAFTIEMQLQQLRVAKAEADLEKIKKHLATRMKAIDTIVDQRVAELAESQKPRQPEGDDVPASVLATEGWQLWKKRDLRSALVKFKASIAKDPTDPHALNGLGWSLLQTGQYNDAVVAFEKGRKIEPDNGGILNGLGQAFQALGRNDDARKLLIESIDGINEKMGEAIAIKRGLTAPWMVLVRLDIDTKDYDKAIEWAERYLKHKPDDKVMLDLLDQAKAGKAETTKAK